MNVSLEKKSGEVVIEADTMLLGEVDGDVVVLPGAKLDVSTTVTGDITLRKHSKAAIRGEINGNLYDEGAQIEIIGAGKVKGVIIKDD